MHVIKLAVAIVAFTPAAAFAQTATPAPAAAAAGTASPATSAYSTSDTDIGTLLANPETKAVLVKHVPAMASSDQIQMASAMTLRQIQSYAGATLTDEVLAQIDTDLAKIPVKK